MNSHAQLMQITSSAYSAKLDELKKYATGYHFQLNQTKGFNWLLFSKKNKKIPASGWKIHFSISTNAIIDDILLIGNTLINIGATFKIPQSLAGVMMLNSGHAGSSQVGKIVTIYPTDDDESKRIVNHLSVLDVEEGPIPPSDYKVAGCKGIYLRYGCFTNTDVRWTKLGRPYNVFIDENGNEFEDKRILETGDKNMHESPLALIKSYNLSNTIETVSQGKSSYISIGKFTDNPSYRVDLALNIDSLDICVMKRAGFQVGGDLIGNSSGERLRNEYKILSELSGTKIAPDVLGYDDGNACLITEYVEGVRGDLVMHNKEYEVLIELARSVQNLHKHGYVHRDVKSSNCILNKKFTEARLIDFELSAKVGEEKPIGGGTFGYIPQEGFIGKVYKPYDIYGLGASLAKWSLGIDPGKLPHLNNREIILQLLSSRDRKITYDLYSKFTHPNPLRRPSAKSTVKILNAYKKITSQEKAKKIINEEISVSELKKWIKVATKTMPLALAPFSVKTRNGIGWRNNSLLADFNCSSINIGSAGILVGLVYLLSFDRKNQIIWDLIDKTSSQLLIDSQSSHGVGLFTGDSGIALALAIAGKCLQEQAYITRSEEILNECLIKVDNEWDLFSGSSGMILGGTIISGLTGNTGIIKCLQPIIDRILEDAITNEGILCWRSTKDYDKDERCFLGAAHGAAGVALSLSKWGHGAGDNGKEAIEISKKIYQGIFEKSRSAVKDNILETVEGGYRPPQHWCHGIAGYLWCILQSFGDSRELIDAKKWAINSFNKNSPIADLTCYCHGLPGILETWLLIEQHAINNDNRLLLKKSVAFQDSLAFSLKCLSQDFNGAIAWSDEDVNDITPDLWVGFLGTIISLNNYSSANTRPMLSLEGIKEALNRIHVS